MAEELTIRSLENALEKFKAKYKNSKKPVMLSPPFYRIISYISTRKNGKRRPRKSI